MNRSRDTWLAIGLFVLLGLITLVAAVQEVRSQTVDPPLASFSTQADGAQLLYRWLADIGFTVDDVQADRFAVPDAAGMVMILEPSDPISAADWVVLDDWIANGGTLLLAGSQSNSSQAFAHFDVFYRVLFIDGAPTVDTPLTTQPVVPTLETLERVRYLDSTRDDLVPLVSINGRPVVVTFPVENGRVIFSSLVDPFTNYGLQQDGHAELILNLLGEANRTVWFDEWHHGVRPAQAVSSNWIRNTPIGRAILYSIAVMFVWLLLRGRNFGRPVPLQKDIVRRSPLEFVTAVANISRKAGHRRAVQRDTHDRLKRRLSQRYRLSPTLPDDEFVETLADYVPTLDKAALLSLLTRLRRPNLDEATLVQLVQEATKFEI